MSKVIKNNTMKEIIDIIILTIGTMISSYALEAFLVHNNILDGGVTGIAIILSKISSIPLSFLILVISIPFFFVGFKNLGKGFLIRSIYSMVLFSLSLSLFELIEPVTEDMLLATVFGGILLGVGTGTVIRFGGCLDGSESVALVISKNTNLSVGQIVLIFNLVIYGVAGFIFGLDSAMYSILTYFITFKVIDFISEGLEQAKAALIITDHGTSLSKEIYKKLGRTTTTLRGKGLISGQKEVLYCVLTRIEIYELKKIVDNMDESAFITILDVSDIIGNHIKANNKIRKLGVK